ncbi:disulfide bond formation protein B [Alicyclobacillus shizuokensis]|uniref:disulfide bond formation protein B n=1 Tax=Alicyclobacillus shizuokensis TaxID=392014 RepID=UPI00082F1F87|nr:disulfide bond formation protein B [Alicyclobacillus shizuokensis]
MDRWALLRLALSVVASGISLYWSLGLGWLPCDLCWYERICMYPIALISLVSMARRIPSRPYTLPLAAVGGCVSLYHYLIQMVPALNSSTSCTSFVSCATPDFVVFGFITPPLLALVAFLAILGLDVLGHRDRRA